MYVCVFLDSSAHGSLLHGADRVPAWPACTGVIISYARFSRCIYSLRVLTWLLLLLLPCLQAQRLSWHPSIALWCGNNEIDLSYEWSNSTVLRSNRNMFVVDYQAVFIDTVRKNIKQVREGSKTAAALQLARVLADHCVNPDSCWQGPHTRRSMVGLALQVLSQCINNPAFDAPGCAHHLLACR